LKIKIYIGKNEDLPNIDRSFDYLKGKLDKYWGDVIVVNSSSSQFEYPALKRIWDDSQNEEFFGLYLHCKGASKTIEKEFQNGLAWLEYMLYGLVDNMELCLEHLSNGADLVGSMWYRHFKGNCFWFRSDYVRGLKNPMELDQSNRYQAEYWIAQHYWWGGYRYPKVKNLFYLPICSDNDFLNLKTNAVIPDINERNKCESISSIINSGNYDIYDDIELSVEEFNIFKDRLIQYTSYDYKISYKRMNHIYQNIDGWFTFPELYKNVVEKFKSGKFVEVGTWLGKSASYLAVEIINSGKDIKLDCVDTWNGSQEHLNMDLVKNDELYNQFLKNIEPVSAVINPIRMDSIEASKLYDDESIDFIFIDASHDYENVKKDIEAWYPKLKDGGIFAGHDFSADWPGVISAVNEFASAEKYPIEVGEYCWMITKRSMYLNIVTPCSRPENLKAIGESINIPSDRFRWIVVFDCEEGKIDQSNIPSNCEYYFHKDSRSCYGNAQRNFALDLIDSGYIYFNDDDTLIHPLLWEEIKSFKCDFISFDQEKKSGELRLVGGNICIGNVDSHNVVIHKSLVMESRFELGNYSADGVFISECYTRSKNNFYIKKVLSTYNLLNPNKS